MLTRLTVREGQTIESARQVFDGQFGVSGWGTPRHRPRQVAIREPGAPWWWQDAEDASQSFLASMGVVLDG
jgi:hypothetical protein